MSGPRGLLRVGVGGPVGSGKTALIERLVPILISHGVEVAVVTNDIFTREDEAHVKAALRGVLEEGRIVGVETGACPHSAVREDPSLNLQALRHLVERYPDLDLIFVESGGDNLTLTFSPELVDVYIYVVDVAGGDKIPRKRGTGLMLADLLVINKVDLAPFVGADMDVMTGDARLVRGGRAQLLTNCRSGEGVAKVEEWVRNALIGDRNDSEGWTIAGHSHSHKSQSIG